MAEDKKTVTKKTVTKKTAAAAAVGSSAPVTKKVVAKKVLSAPSVEPAAPPTKKTAAKKAPAKKAAPKQAPAPESATRAPLPDRAVLLKPVGDVTPEQRYRTGPPPSPRSTRCSRKGPRQTPKYSAFPAGQDARPLSVPLRH